jgi:hypothetical protein
VLSILALLLDPFAGQAGEREGGRCPIVTRKSAHFVVHTDSPIDEADRALLRMEETLRFAVSCWGKELGEEVECFLVRDLDNWPKTSLPHPLARIFVGHVGGATLAPSPTNAKIAGVDRVIIYASARPGIVEHEVMHAYCSVIFGEGGPGWFREGMAEMASFRESTALGVRCPPERLAELRKSEFLPISHVRKLGRSNKRLADSLATMLTNRSRGVHHVELDAWSDQDSRSLAQARHEYLWSWALCHLLYHNPNYSDRFRTLADCYLSGRNVPFDQVFASMQREMMFEYQQFVLNAGSGYRVDLCRWDWNHRFVSPESGVSVDSRCDSSRGWQASGLTVVRGTHYAYRADGTWSNAPESQRTNADGGQGGTGRLSAVIMHDYRLGEPFSLGTTGIFVAPASGRLFLRCTDAWNALENNDGTVQIELTRLAANSAR